MRVRDHDGQQQNQNQDHSHVFILKFHPWGEQSTSAQGDGSDLRCAHAHGDLCLCAVT